MNNECMKKEEKLCLSAPFFFIFIIMKIYTPAGMDNENIDKGDKRILDRF
jgi:hypothetical protein